MPKVTKWVHEPFAWVFQWLFKDPWLRTQTHAERKHPETESVDRSGDVQYTLTEKFKDIGEDATSASGAMVFFESIQTAWTMRASVSDRESRTSADQYTSQQTHTSTAIREPIHEPAHEPSVHFIGPDDYKVLEREHNR